MEDNSEPEHEFTCYFSFLSLDHFNLTDHFSLKLLQLNGMTYFTLIFVAFIVIIIYTFIRIPVNKVIHWSDVGYSSDTSLFWASCKSKVEHAKEVHQRRAVGELPPIYPNGWFALLESSDLQYGQVKHVQALGENFAVFRGHTGDVHVLDAYCPHLGANMAVGGAVKGDCLECPFHAWQFRGQDGQCSYIPYSDKVPPFARVKKWQVREVNDVIFVWYHAEGAPPSWQVERVDQIESKAWWYRGRVELSIKCHPQDISENAADFAHFPQVHGSPVLGKSFARHVMVSNSWSPDPDPLRRHVSATTGEHRLRLLSGVSCFPMAVNITQFGPGYMSAGFKVGLGEVLTLVLVTPVAPLQCRMIHRVYCHPLLSPLGSLTVYFEANMIKRDVAIWNHKKYVSKPVLAKEDEAVLRHRRWYSQFYSVNSPRYSHHIETLDW